MNFAFFWSELLAVSLLWTATLAAVGARVGTRLFTWLLGVLPISAVLLGVLGLTAFMKFGKHFEQTWFGYFLSLFLAYVVGAGFLLRRAKRKPIIDSPCNAKKWPLLILVFGVLLACVVTSTTYRSMDSNAQERMERADQEAAAIRLPITGRAISESDNAAPLYYKAFSRIADDKAINGPDSLLDDDPDVDEFEVIAMLARQEPTIELLHEAARLPDCRFNHDYSLRDGFSHFPELNKLRIAAVLLSWHAKSELLYGRVDSALSDVNAIWAASDAAGRYPGSILEILVASGLRAMGDDVFEQILTSITDPRQFSGLQLVQETEVTVRWKRALRGEEAYMMGMFVDVSDHFTDMGISSAVGRSQPPILRAAHLQTDSLMRVFLIPHDLEGYRAQMAHLSELVGHPYYEAIDAAKNSEGKIRRAGWISSICSENFERVLTQVSRDEVSSRLVATAVAMTRFRVAHAAFPDSLDRLVPEYLAKVPVDPFNGQPLRLVHKGDQRIVYSVGPDGIDDGGVSYKNSRSHRFDLPFVLTTK